MLPDRKSSEFPKALKRKREELRMTNKELADAVEISPVMIGRYEHTTDKGFFTTPSVETWRKLNAFFNKRDETKFETEECKYNTIQDATIEEIIKLLKQRGAKSVNIEW